MNFVKVPQSPKDVTKTWLKEALDEISDEKVEILEVTLVGEKIGFLSSAIKAKVKLNGKFKNLFIKTMVDTEDPAAKKFEEILFDQKEIVFYKELMPYFNLIHEKIDSEGNKIDVNVCFSP